MGQLIQQQTNSPSTYSPQSSVQPASAQPARSTNTRYRRVIGADGVVTLVRVDEGS